MKLSQLRYLVALKEHGTISKTAEKLYISQPTLSIAIKELEEELGFDVIKRTRKGTTFTSRGEKVLQHSEKIMSEVDEILKMSIDRENFLSGRISIGCVPYIMHSLILDTVIDLEEKFPSMSTRLIENNSYDILEQVYRRDIDLGIIMVSNIEEEKFREFFKEHHIEFYELINDEMYLWCGKENPLYHQDNVSLKDALQTSFVVYKNVLNAFNKNKLLEFNHDLEFVHVDDKEGLRKYLAKSQAVTIMPMCAVWEDHHYFEKGFIKPLRVKDFSWTVKLGVIYVEDEIQPIEVQTFLKMLKERGLELYLSCKLPD